MFWSITRWFADQRRSGPPRSRHIAGTGRPDRWGAGGPRDVAATRSRTSDHPVERPSRRRPPVASARVRRYPFGPRTTDRGRRAPSRVRRSAVRSMEQQHHAAPSRGPVGCGACRVVGSSHGTGTGMAAPRVHNVESARRAAIATTVQLPNTAPPSSVRRRTRTRRRRSRFVKWSHREVARTRSNSASRSAAVRAPSDGGGRWASTSDETGLTGGGTAPAMSWSALEELGT